MIDSSGLIDKGVRRRNMWWLREARKELILTQREMAELFGISQGTIANWENGSRTPHLGKIKSIVSVLEEKGIRINHEEIFGDSELPDHSIVINCDKHDEHTGRTVEIGIETYQSLLKLAEIGLSKLAATDSVNLSKK